MENFTANDLRSLYAQRKATKNALETLRTNTIRQLGLDLMNSHAEMSTTEIAAKYGLPVEGIYSLLTDRIFMPDPNDWNRTWRFRGHKRTIPLYYRMTDAAGNPFGPVQTIVKKICTWSVELR